MKVVACVLATTLLAAACGGGVSYRPVAEVDFDRLLDKGCTRADDRFAVTAQINAAYRETIVLWDGRDGSRTVAVTLPEEGLGSKMRGVIGDSRYDLSLERLTQLRDRGTPVTINLRCERAGAAPTADRFSYMDDGQRIEFEF